MKPPLTHQDLVRLSRMMETGLKSGRDWISILAWVSQSDHRPKTREYLQRLERRLKLDSVENVLIEEGHRSKDLLWRMFMEILLQANRGTAHFSNLFRNFSGIGKSVIELREKEKSLLFIPRFQTWMSLVMTVGFTWGLPALSPGLFPTFLTVHRADLFAAGLSLILIGFAMLHWICSMPQRTLAPRLSYSFFFYFLSIHLESGLDLVTSWYRSLDAVILPKAFKAKVMRPGLNVESMDDYLRELRAKLDGSWPQILTGLLWAKASGIGLSQYLREVSQEEANQLLFTWEDEIRKLTMFSLLPLGLLVFPGTLFLLVGPQLLELVTSL